MNRIVHVVRDLDVASGGPSRSVPALAESQALLSDTKVMVIYQDRGFPVVSLNNDAVHYQPVRIRDFLFFDQFYLDEIKDSDGKVIFHLHGIWSPTLHLVARFARNSGIPYIVSVRGMLSEWCLGYKSLKKKIGWLIYQHHDLQGANAVIASSVAEKADIKTQVSHAAIVVIPNGCKEISSNGCQHSLLPKSKDTRWVLFLGRLHPVKGLEMLISAWSLSQAAGWKLAIAGPDESGYQAVLKQQVDDLELADQIIFLGEVGEREKWGLLAACELLVAPSESENFGMAIAEALQTATPVITTMGTPWQEIQQYHCGWWIENDRTTLVQTLQAAIKMDAKELHAMGKNGRQLIQEHYSWASVVQQTLSLYEEVHKS